MILPTGVSGKVYMHRLAHSAAASAPQKKTCTHPHHACCKDARTVHSVPRSRNRFSYIYLDSVCDRYCWRLLKRRPTRSNGRSSNAREQCRTNTPRRLPRAIFLCICGIHEEKRALLGTSKARKTCVCLGKTSAPPPPLQPCAIHLSLVYQTRPATASRLK